MTIEQMRAAYAAATRSLEEAAQAIETAPDDIPADDLGELQETANEAAAEAERTKKNLDAAERVARAREQHPRAADPEPAAGEARTPVEVGREPMTYDRGSGHSFFRDLYMAQRQADPQAGARLRRHMDEVAVERRDINRTDGTGGEFVPPLWLVDDYIALARAGRPTAELVSKMPLPAGTDSINLPKIATGTAVAAQTSDNAAVQETDLTTSTVTAPVTTIAGQQDVSIQLLEQSPIAFDQVIFQDLLADYALKVNRGVLFGTGASGQVTGLTVVAGTNSITYTDASPTVPELWPKLADALNQAQSGRVLPGECFIMHPRRWYWMVAALDTASRPFVVPIGPSAEGYNAQGVLQRHDAQGPVGMVMGLPVYLDPSIPTNLGAGTNEDVILVGRFSDAWLMEGTLRTRTLPEVLSGTLTVRMQVYNYVAFTAARYPAGISKIGGTGLITPTF